MEVEKGLLKSILNVLNSQPHWIVILFLSVVLAYLLPIVIEVIYHTYLIIFGAKSAFVGEWYSYHFSCKGKPIVVYSSVEIKKGFMSLYHVKLWEHLNSKPIYSGNVKRERDHLIIRLSSKTPPENVIIRLKEPIGTNGKKKMYGLWLSYDHGHIIAAGGILFSRDQILDNVEEAISAGFQMSHGQRPFARVVDPDDD